MDEKLKILKRPAFMVISMGYMKKVPMQWQIWYKVIVSFKMQIHQTLLDLWMITSIQVLMKTILFILILQRFLSQNLLMASLRLQVSASEIAKQVIDLGLGNVSSKQQILINYVWSIRLRYSSNSEESSSWYFA